MSDRNADLMATLCMIALGMLLAIPIGALFHIGWNLVG